MMIILLEFANTYDKYSRWVELSFPGATSSAQGYSRRKCESNFRLPPQVSAQPLGASSNRRLGQTIWVSFTQHRRASHVYRPGQYLLWFPSRPPPHDAFVIMRLLQSRRYESFVTTGFFMYKNLFLIVVYDKRVCMMLMGRGNGQRIMDGDG